MRQVRIHPLGDAAAVIRWRWDRQTDNRRVHPVNEIGSGSDQSEFILPTDTHGIEIAYGAPQHRDAVELPPCRESPASSDAVIANDIVRVARALRNRAGNTFIDIVPAYDTVTVHFSPLILTWSDVVIRIRDAMAGLTSGEMTHHRLIEIPVCYGGEFGSDLTEVANLHNLTVSEVIRIHAEARYTVRMIGFAPGFPYLDGLPDILHTPRLPVPRIQVPAGSVAIGGMQAGIYPSVSPGGWRIIGRTPIPLFDPEREHPCVLTPGDEVRFVPVSPEEYTTIMSRTSVIEVREQQSATGDSQIDSTTLGLC